LESERKRLQAEFNSEQQKLQREIILSQQNYDRLKAEVKNSDEKILLERSRFEQQMFQERKEWELAFNEKDAEILHRESHIQKQSEEIADLHREIDNFRELLSAKDKQIQSEERKLAFMQAKNQEALTANSQLLKAKEELEGKVAQLTNQLSDAAVSAAEKNHRLIDRIRRLKQRHGQDIESLSSEIEAKLIDKMKAIEDEIKFRDAQIAIAQSEQNSLRQELEKAAAKLRLEQKKRKKEAQLVDDLRVENERLRNLMREKTDSLNAHETAVSEFHRLKNLLGLEPGASAETIIEVASSSQRRKQR
jgi:chromosome segregation ATPase